jgi:uncharacterized protein (TIGR00290 family)
MDTRPRAFLSWSSGKDSAMTLARVLERREFRVEALVTTVSEAFERVAIHGVRERLLDRQAERLGLPLVKVPLPFPCSNAVYEERLAFALAPMRETGITHAIYGDLFLADIRKYREEWLAKQELEPVFPLWGEDTARLSREMLAHGSRAILSAVDTKKLPASFAGREFDAKLLAELPRSTDPCGENGEFHTFVYDSPNFTKPIAVAVGEKVHRDGVEYCDIVEIP